MGGLVKMNPEILKLRRRIVLAIVRREPGASARDVLAALLELHGVGQWPRMPNPGAQNTPYMGQVSSMLTFLVERGLLVEYRDTVDGWTRRWITPEGHKAKAEALLPPEEGREALMEQAREFQRVTGFEVAFAVTDRLAPIVRVMTARGPVDFPVDDGSWEAALADALEDLQVAA